MSNDCNCLNSKEFLKIHKAMESEEAMTKALIEQGRKEREAEIIEMIGFTYGLDDCKCIQCRTARDIIKQIKQEQDNGS